MFKKASERAETALKKNASNARILEKLGQERANLHWQLGLNSQHISAENAAKIADTVSFQYLTMSPCHHHFLPFKPTTSSQDVLWIPRPLYRICSKVK